jgi:xanthine dehydrogenase accessory factor
MDERDVYSALLAAQNKGIGVALATVIRTSGSMPRHAGSKMLVYSDGRIVGTVGGGAMEARVIADAQAAMNIGKAHVAEYTLNDLRDGDPGICGGTAEIFIEPMLSRPTLLVIGGGHVGKALAELGKWLDFRVVISDDRPEFCNAAYLPNLDGYLLSSPATLTDQLTGVYAPTAQTYIAAVTRGLPVDEALLPPLIRWLNEGKIAYLGLIGSRRRWALTVNMLEGLGFTRAELAKLYAPIGLELNAETPQEIAVSIMAEITLLRRGGNGGHMRWLGANGV